jgi:NAD(P)-dependent dehydrogenase (short-subunit alcohol dehydrogenase family)
MADRALGWQITVQLAQGGALRIYNVAIAEEHEAVEAVKRTLDSAACGRQGKVRTHRTCL